MTNTVNVAHLRGWFRWVVKEVERDGVFPLILIGGVQTPNGVSVALFPYAEAPDEVVIRYLRTAADKIEQGEVDPR